MTNKELKDILLAIINIYKEVNENNVPEAGFKEEVIQTRLRDFHTEVEAILIKGINEVTDPESYVNELVSAAERLKLSNMEALFVYVVRKSDNAYNMGFRDGYAEGLVAGIKRMWANSLERQQQAVKIIDTAASLNEAVVTEEGIKINLDKPEDNKETTV